MYKVLILIGATTETDLHGYEKAIEERFASRPEDVSTEIQGPQLTVNVDGFRFVIIYQCGEHVSIESQEIAEMFASGREDAAVIASSKCRFEVSSDNDPGGDHFNDFIYLMEAAERAGEVFLFDPAAGVFM